MKKSALLNLAVLVVVNLLWAAQYPAYKIASDHMDVAALNFWVLVFALLLLVPLRLRQIRKFACRQSGFRWRSIREFVLLGVLGIVPPSVMLAWGISHSSASNAAILSLTIPILMTGLGVIMLGERLTTIRTASLMLGLLGTFLVSTNDLAHVSFDRKLLIGNFAILIAGAGSAFYNTYSKDLLSRYSELQVLIYSYVVAAAACAVISISTESAPFFRVTGYPVQTWLAVLFLGAISWGLAMILWMWVLNRLEIGQISASIYLLPFFGLLLSVIFVHEHIKLTQILGGSLTLIGTATLMFYENRQTTRNALP